MPEDNAPSTALTTSPTPPPRREVRVVESVSPIMDTARFEHLGRVATVMATAGLMPDSLTTFKDEPLDFAVIQARAFLICNQADLWKADPNAVAQCCSLVHGKLMFEGKLVHGLIETRLGVRLRYDFGTYNHSAKTVDVGQMPAPGDQSLGVQVSGRFDDEDFDRTIIGSVAMWHRGPKSPWNVETAWMRQLRYMGAREWARAHSPGLLLGIMTDDEIEDAYERRSVSEAPAPKGRVKNDLRAKLAAPTEAQPNKEGFDPAHTERELAPHDPQTGEVEETDPQDTVTAGASDAAAEPASSDSATDAPSDIAAATSGATASDGSSPSGGNDASNEAAKSNAPVEGQVLQDTTEEWTFKEDHDGPAPAGKVYVLAGEDVGEDGKLQTYQDGQPFSRVGRKGAAALPLYELHTETAQAQAQPDEAETPAADEGDPAPPAGVFSAFWENLLKVEAWAPAKSLILALYKTDDFKALEEDEQNALRAKIWHKLVELKATADPAAQPTAFRLWLETLSTPDDGDALIGNFRVLEMEPVFVNMSPENKASLKATHDAALAKLKGAK